MLNRPSGLLLAITLAAPAVAAAQHPDSTSLPAVVVTATREPTSVSAMTQPVTVLTGDALRARGVTTVADALREVAGAAVAQSGSPGAVSSLFMRGGESRYTKVLVDGVAVNTVGGTVFLQNLTLDNVDRIEIVQGPASALYGADAMTGVVQIFTRRGSDRGADLAVDGGTYGTRDATGSVRAGSRVANLSLGGGWHHTDGLVSFNNGYTNGTLSAEGALHPVVGSSVRVTSRYSGATYHFPTDYAGNVADTNSYTREHRLVVGVDASQAIGSFLTLRFLGGDMEVHGLTEDRQAAPGDGAGTFNTSQSLTSGQRHSAEGRAELSLPGATRVTIGVPYVHESESTLSGTRYFAAGQPAGSNASGTFDMRTTHGVYGALQGAPAGWLAYDASVRHDRHTDFHSITTYHAGVSVAPWSGARLRAAYGTGFNAPAFYETLGTAYNLPNMHLQPEQTRSVDLGVEQDAMDGRVNVHVGAFDQHFSQLIQYVPIGNPVTGTGVYQNLTSARSHGYTGGIRLLPVQGLSVSADYTQTIARVVSVPPSYHGAAPGDALLRRPSHSGSAALTYGKRGWTAGAVLTYVGSRPDVDFQKYPSPTVALPAYTTLDLSGSFPAFAANGAAVALTARVQNALDRHYEEIDHFPAMGRTILVGARVTASP